MMDYEKISLGEYSPSGEGGTAITYKHNTRNALAKLYKSGFEADMAVEEFKVAKAEIMAAKRAAQAAQQAKEAK